MSEQTNDIKMKKNNSSRKDSHILAKILCVVAAFFLWIYVMSVESPEHEEPFSHIAVNLENVDELTDRSLAVYNGYGTLIDVTLAGKKSVLSKLNEEDIVATVDVSDIESSGRYSCKITVDVPSGCKLVGQSQDALSVYVDRAEKSMIDLTELRENTNLPDDAFTGSVEFPVDKITVEGPAMVVSKVAGALVTLDMSGVTKTTKMTCPVTLVDSSGVEVNSPYLNFYPSVVEVTVPVLKTVMIPVLTEFKYGFLNSENTVITMNPAELEATGSAEIISRLDLKPVISFDEKTDFADSPTAIKSLTLEIPEGVALSSETVDAEVTLGKDIKTRTITVPGANITDTGGKKNIRYTWVKDDVPVTIMGTSDKVSKIEADDISLVLDMSPYSKNNTGTITVKAEVIIDSAYSEDVIELGTYEISVTFVR